MVDKRPVPTPAEPVAGEGKPQGTCANSDHNDLGIHAQRNDCDLWEYEPSAPAVAPEEEALWQECLPWNPEIERVRKEMLRRFSDKLSMEEIAAFAYETFQPATPPTSPVSADERDVREALRGILELGRKDLSNPKYDSYFDFAWQSLDEREAFSKIAPTEQGWYWHWSGDHEASPVPTSVMKSGTNGKCFVSLGQLGLNRAVDCDEYGGLWCKLRIPVPVATSPVSGAGMTAEIRTVLMRLRNEINGWIGLEEPALRQLFGNTNFGVMEERIREAAFCLREAAHVLAEKEK